MLRLELAGRQVVEAHVGSDGVVVMSPGFDQDLGLGAGAKPLDAQAFVAELAVERLAGSVLPRLAGIDEGGVDPVVGKPPEDGRADEFRTIVGAQIGRCAMHTDQAGENVDDATRANAAGDIDRQAFMGEFIDHGQAFQLLAVGAGIEDEVVGPDVVGCHGWQGTGARRGSAPWPLARQLQLGLAPQAFGPTRTHRQAFPVQEDPDAAIAVAGIL